MTVRVKICGITRIEDAELALALGADMIGLNFYPPSPRALTIDRAREIRCCIGRQCEVVGVFVNATRAYVDRHLHEVGLDLLQFHGDEREAELTGWPVKVIRALRVRTEDLAESIARTCADYILLDTFHPGLFGGTGHARPLEGLEGLDLGRVILAGGLSPENVAQAAGLNPFALDVASGVESSAGVKDAAKLRSFIANAKFSR
jgi:phosphoribosylanthranilate isomerase